VKGRLEKAEELGSFISDPELEKYKAQQRVVLWYDMNEHRSSDTVIISTHVVFWELHHLKLANCHHVLI
jgi:hypothetical protein